MERGDKGTSLFPFCSSDCLDGQWIGARENHARAIGELLIEWPEGSVDPVKFWLSSLSPRRTSWRRLVRRAKGRYRVEQDYREMKRELGFWGELKLAAKLAFRRDLIEAMLAYRRLFQDYFDYIGYGYFVGCKPARQ